MLLKDELRKLLELQKIDLQIYNLKRRQETEIPDLREKIGLAFEEKKKETAAADARLKELQVKKKGKEVDLAGKEEGIKKAQSQLYQLKTNREYSAKLNEIASLKADTSLFEEDILRIMEEIEAADKKLKEEKEKLSIEEKKFKEETTKLDGQLGEIGVEIKQQEDKKNTLVRDVDKNILAQYEKLLKSRSGIAMSAVDNQNCGACHMNITAQKVNEIKMYANLIFCESCQRILYIQEDIL